MGFLLSQSVVFLSQLIYLLLILSLHRYLSQIAPFVYLPVCSTQQGQLTKYYVTGISLL